MIPYGTIQEVEAVLGRSTTWAEAAWFRYSAAMPDWCLLCHSIVLVSGIIYMVVPLPILLLEQLAPAVILPYKLQPEVPPSSFLQYIRSSGASMLLGFVCHLLMYLVTFKIAGIRTGIPLPSVGEMVAKVVVYALIDDYLNYWFHRFEHTPWGYTNFHYLHHEVTAPNAGFAGALSHWAEVVIGSIPTILGPVIVPCHVTTHWLWYAIHTAEVLETHLGYDFPFNPSKLIPFYGGAEYHDYHHRVGGRQNNFGPFFTYLDYIYGTDKGYRSHKASLAERKKLAGEDSMEKTGSNQEKLD